MLCDKGLRNCNEDIGVETQSYEPICVTADHAKQCPQGPGAIELTAVAGTLKAALLKVIC